ncbi:MAG TPA: SDR family oxidoreductase [Bacteroidales bacterium]|nr:SDR family oxidoreductase [Bacteroidales bacterium]
MALINETALITGATSGIGYELAKLFAADKARLVIVSRGEEMLWQVSKEFRDLGAPDVTIIPKDLSIPGAAEDVYARTKELGINISILVNDAGVGEHGYFSEIDLEKEDTIINLNVVSLVHLTKLYLRDMLNMDHGRILNLASIASYQPTPTLAVYAASKAFVLSFTDALIHELQDTGITITALIPGPADTDFFRKAHAENTKAALDNPQDPAKVAKAGYEGLLKGKHHVTSKFSVQAQVAMSTAMPNEAVSSMASTYMKEKK